MPETLRIMRTKSNGRAVKTAGSGKKRMAMVDAVSFSFFRAPVVGLEPCLECTPGFVYRYLVSDYAKLRTLALRDIAGNGGGGIVRKMLDEEFDFVTFAGVFRRKTEAELLRPSRLVCLHFGNVPDVHVAKAYLLAERSDETVMLFCDVYGTGLNWVVRNDGDMAHTDFFRMMDRDIFNDIGLDADCNGKVMSDAVYLPWDGEAFIHPAYMKAEFDKAPDDCWRAYCTGGNEDGRD